MEGILIWILMENTLLSSPLLIRPYMQVCLLAGHRYWIWAFEMIHLSIHPLLPKSTARRARLIDNFKPNKEVE